MEIHPIENSYKETNLESLYVDLVQNIEVLFL